MNEITVQDLHVLLSSHTNQRMQVIDVREPDEYNVGHIPNALNVPLSSLAMSDTPVISASATVYVVCASGGRSARAAMILTNAGYTAINVIGGTNGWKMAGYAISV